MKETWCKARVEVAAVPLVLSRAVGPSLLGCCTGSHPIGLYLETHLSSLLDILSPLHTPCSHEVMT